MESIGNEVFSIGVEKLENISKAKSEIDAIFSKLYKEENPQKCFYLSREISKISHRLDSAFYSLTKQKLLTTLKNTRKFYYTKHKYLYSKEDYNE